MASRTASPVPQREYHGDGYSVAAPSLRLTRLIGVKNPLRSTATPVGAEPRDVAVSLGLATSVGSRPP